MAAEPRASANVERHQGAGGEGGGQVPLDGQERVVAAGRELTTPVSVHDLCPSAAGCGISQFEAISALLSGARSAMLWRAARQHRSADA
jgi:hypothetical protein